MAEPRSKAALPHLVERSFGTFARRQCVDQLTPVERAIFDAVGAIEEMPADERLTRAQTKLEDARGLLADYLEGRDTVCTPVDARTCSACALPRYTVAGEPPFCLSCRTMRDLLKAEVDRPLDADSGHSAERDGVTCAGCGASPGAPHVTDCTVRGGSR